MSFFLYLIFRATIFSLAIAFVVVALLAWAMLWAVMFVVAFIYVGITEKPLKRLGPPTLKIPQARYSSRR